MKKLFVSVLALAGLVACNTDYVIDEVNNSQAITFGGVSVDNATRSNPSTTTNNIEAFSVWAYMNEVDGCVFNDELVTRSGDAWTYVNTQYWLPGNTYHFAAFSGDRTAVVGLPTAMGANGLGTITFTNVDGTNDILYAEDVVEAGDTYTSPVDLDFAHLLSKVKFTFKNGFANNNNTIVVENIKMKAPMSASVDLSSDDLTWSAWSEELVELTFGNMNGANKLEILKSASSDDERFTIPAPAAQEYIITFNVTLYNGAQVGIDARPMTVKLNGFEFEAGRAYNLVATINQENLNLNAIEFEVEVDEWEQEVDESYNLYYVEVDGVSYNDFAEAAAAAMASDKAVDFKQDVVIDADATITVPANKTLTLNLNGNTLKGISDQTGSNRNFFDVRGTMNVNNGSVTYKHIGANMGWNSSTNVFNVTAGGVLNLDGVTAINYGGSDMGFVAHLNNWGEVTLNVENSTLESNYVAVRVFNSGNDMNNVAIHNSTLKGGNYAFWVHNYTVADFGTEAKADAHKALLNLDIFDGTNEFIGKNDTPIRWGMTNAEYSFANGAVYSEEGYTVNNDSYSVYSADGLMAVATELSNSGSMEDVEIELTRDIDLSELVLTRSAVASNWEPFGTSEKPFTGTFDGNGYTIKNLALVETEAKEGKAYIGFFGYANNATIKNVTFENVYINIPCLDIDHSQGHIGAVAGSLEGTSTIENVTVKGDIKIEATPDANGASRVAVVAGGNAYGNVTIKNVHVVANEGSYLKANNNTGAIAGQLQGKTVYENCSSNIDVTVNKFFAGGIVGLAGTNDKFINCHTTGNIAVVAGRAGRANDHYRVGGIAGGWADGKTNVLTLENCSYTGTISGKNSDGSVAEVLDYMGYVGRGYTLTNCEGSKVIIDNLCFVQVGNAAPYGNYNVTTVDGNAVIKISTAEELNNLKATNAYVVLMADIDFGGAAMTKPIELWKDSTFDGNGHKISNVGTAVQGGYATSLFRGDANPGNKVVKNLVIENLYTPAGYSYAAAIWSDLQGANILIDNVHVNNSKIQAKGTVGGFVGFVSGSTTYVVVKNSTISNSDLNGGEADHKRGAVVGRAYGCVVNCENVVVENVDATEATLVGDKGYTGTVTVK